MFNELGFVKNPGSFFRQQSFLLAKETYTPINYWLDLTIFEFFSWITEINEVDKEKEKGR